ncbi:MAG: T9SS type A sorting domain-containing protein, partial [Flavobacteriales bacterium]|nr:T9SS type A sorting domain-containing protein [Flavobacteriales bacterium]
NGVFNVEVNATETAEYTFIVRNVIGQTVSSSTETINGNFIKTIDLSNQTTGMYFLTVKSVNSEKTAKIILK